jgi:hypothetical protein
MNFLEIKQVLDLIFFFNLFIQFAPSTGLRVQLNQSSGGA